MIRTFLKSLLPPFCLSILYTYSSISLPLFHKRILFFFTFFLYLRFPSCFCSVSSAERMNERRRKNVGRSLSSHRKREGLNRVELRTWTRTWKREQPEFTNGKVLPTSLHDWQLRDTLSLSVLQFFFLLPHEFSHFIFITSFHFRSFLLPWKSPVLCLIYLTGDTILIEPK